MSVAPRIIGLATAVPAHVVLQADVRRFASALFSSTIGADGRLLEIFENAQIDKRHLCMPLEWPSAFATC